MTPLTPVATRIRWAKRIERAFLGVAWLLLGTLAAVFIGLFASMLHTGWTRLQPDFLLTFASRRADQAGVLAAWVGTLVVMVVTAAVAVPLGVAAGVYLEEYARPNRFTALIEINIVNLAGVPSIVYGLLALGLFVRWLGFGASVLTAGLTLGLLILPIVVVATREALRTVPPTIREASYAVGSTRWQTVWQHVLPAALPGILTGVIIGLSRAIGETAPIVTIGAVTFIAFLPPAPVSPSFPFVSVEWIWSPFTALPIVTFDWTSRPNADFRANAAAAALTLTCLTAAMNGVAAWLRYRLRRQLKW
ncbi:MAG: phosphate ABC transporter permease PstA [Chloracidobacterium sp.]|uniref:Phosphate transport system permease protein PstA n=1 Tax=Chloracidobacterium validum TaxID=2821543 RepID=A0ABX8B7I1_9BACT|nr:phosphate ABC transporter permease PstA [Chloracidobacterium validum]QUW02016.1 phosphate ABC transporter permease PstA [Chloracidobacterium validum]